MSTHYTFVSLYTLIIFLSVTALQQLGYDESSLLNEIEKILGVGPLADGSPQPNSQIEPPPGFTLSEYSKPTSTFTSETTQQTFSSSKSVSNSSGTNTCKWMRTSSGGYVKAPSQENVSSEYSSDYKTKSSPSPVPPKRPAPPSDESQARPFNTSPSPVRVPGSPKFIPNSSDFHQANQFTAQYNSQTTSPTPRRKSPSRANTSNEFIQESQVTSAHHLEDLRGPTPPIRGVASVGAQNILNASPVGYSPVYKGESRH